MRYDFYTADVFTDRAFGGNPLAVFPAADGLSTAHMQRIARELNLSETVFVLPPERPEHTRRLRIFTPATELPFAGHPTIGTAHVLASIGAVCIEGEITRVVFEEGVGPVAVDIRADGNRPVAARLTAAQLPERGPTPPPTADIARVLGLQPADVLNGEWSPGAYSCGVPFLFVPLSGREALARAQLDPAAWREVLADFWAPHVYLVTHQAELPDSHLRARMFAPALGIAEDPATGGAATALAGYLAQHDPTRDGTLSWRVEQGFEMGRPSILEVEADRCAGEITAVRVGGAAVLVSKGVMHVPENLS